MPPKKKNKSNKLASMSEEERLRYLQHRAAMEEESHRRKQQLISTFMNIKLKHEEGFTRLNSAKINQQWRQILREIKCAKLRQDQEDIKQYYDDIINNRNRVIENLLSEIESVEFQYGRQFQEHMENISKFRDIHHERVTKLREWYTQQVDEIKKRHIDKEASIINDIKRDTEIIQMKSDSYSKEYENKRKQLQLLQDDQKNDLQTKMLYRTVKMEEKYDDELAQLHKEYEGILDDYKKNTETKRAHYNILLKKDIEDSKEIMHNYEKIKELTQKIEAKRTELEDIIHDNENEINEMQDDKAKKMKQLMNMRQTFKETNLSENNKIKHLVSVSNLKIKQLTCMVKEGDKLLQVAKECEKLLKCGIHYKIEDLKTSHNDDENELQEHEAEKPLMAFWKHVNQVKMKTQSMKIEKKQVSLENRQLKELLQKRLSSFSTPRSIPNKNQSIKDI